MNYSSAVLNPINVLHFYLQIIYLRLLDMGFEALHGEVSIFIWFAVTPCVYLLAGKRFETPFWCEKRYITTGYYYYY